MDNYQSVIDQMTAHGLLINGGLEVDGRIHRVKTSDDEREKRGWYSLTLWRNSQNRELIVGAYGIWHGADNGAQKVALADIQIDPAERAAINKSHAAAKKSAAAQRAAEKTTAARRAGAVWAKALLTPPTDQPVDYLTRKQVSPYGIRYTESGALVIPMQDRNGSVKGLQFILPSHHPRRQKTGRDKEYWPAGMEKQGHYYLIGSPMNAGIVLIAEGYATAATLHAATGLPVAVAFDANNLQPVAVALRDAYKAAKILICADDDYLTDGNPGCKSAAAAALAVGGQWVAPQFPTDRNGKKHTDFNDLQLYPAGGLALVRSQIQAVTATMGLTDARQRSGALTVGGGGDSGRAMKSLLTIDEAVRRFWGVYGMGGKVVFDESERRLVHKDDMLNILPDRAWGELKRHPGWRVARDTEIGFDPTEKDPAIRCNLFCGWPMEPKRGDCTALLDLLMYLTSNEPHSMDVYDWVLKWLAYPLQHRGAKMHTALVIHGAQGTGKSRFFEAYAKIYGQYARVLGQEALEDKFNADWAEKKLFILADEVLARTDMFHVKNRLKSFITGDTIRVNPKNIAAHTEKNQMNIVFLSNERMPLVLEDDDRRHCVIWVPPKLGDSDYQRITKEIDNGGIEALYDHLLTIDLGDFRPWTKPPMTRAKSDLIHQAASSEERFVQEWIGGDIVGQRDETLPFCPCLGSSLYRIYTKWCQTNGEYRPRPSNSFIGHLSKLAQWSAGKSERTYQDLTAASVNQGRFKNRKMVVPSYQAMTDSAKTAQQLRLLQQPDESKAVWLTRCHFEFEMAVGADNV